MKYAAIVLSILDVGDLTYEEMHAIDIAEAVASLEEQLPELPKGAHWSVDVDY